MPVRWRVGNSTDFRDVYLDDERVGFMTSAAIAQQIVYCLNAREALTGTGTQIHQALTESRRDANRRHQQWDVADAYAALRPFLDGT